MQESPMNTLRIDDGVLGAERQERLDLVRLWHAANNSIGALETAMLPERRRDGRTATFDLAAARQRWKTAVRSHGAAANGILATLVRARLRPMPLAGRALARGCGLVLANCPENDCWRWFRAMQESQ
jgi:hypothetical protein